LSVLQKIFEALLKTQRSSARIMSLDL